MRKVIITTALAAIGSLALAGGASAALVQNSQIKLLPTSGTGKPKNNSYVKLQSYLSTRDAASTRGAKKANPVGKVFMDFPAGSTINKSAKTTCNLSEYSTVEGLASGCASSVLGTGWALLNTGGTTAHDQLLGAPTDCPSSDATQYSRTWSANPAGKPNCLPLGHLWVAITAYQGGVLKSQWWCYGDAGAPKPGAACTNKATGGDAKNTLLATGPANGTFNDLTNKKGMNGCNIIFANDNSAAPLAFGGTDTGCKNRLTVIIPALNGAGSGLGELTGGFVLSDFYLNITAPNYMKAPACPASKTWSVKTQIVFSKLKGETGAVPPSQTITSTETCSK